MQGHNVLEQLPTVFRAATAAPLAAKSSGGGLFPLLSLVVLIGLFYFLLIRPQRNRQRQMMQLQNSLVSGQRVMTTAGLFATVRAVEDDAVVLEVAPGVECRYSKAAVAQVLTTTGGNPAADGGAEGSTGSATDSETQ